MTPAGQVTKLCTVCSAEFGRKRYSLKMEKPSHFAARKTCSNWCRYELIASKNRGRKVSLDLPCSVVGCNRRAVAKTLCNFHWRRNRHGLPIEGTEPKSVHGHARAASGPSPEYKAWASMINRCTCPKRKDYKHYGGRGIGVCRRWADFRSFLGDIGLRPSPQHSLDRINNDGNYEPGNVRWATRSEQHRNMRGNRYIEFNGVRLTITDWSAKTGINCVTLKGRIDDGGWPLEKALTVPVRLGQKVMRRMLVGPKP